MIINMKNYYEFTKINDIKTILNILKDDKRNE